MGKKTIAIIGETGGFCPALAKAAVQQDLRLLFITRDEKDSVLGQELGKLEETAEVEFLTCEKEGCWEADAIAFTRPNELEPALLRRIQEVSTQKIVVVISHDLKAEGEKLCFRDLLPHSKLVELELKGENFRIFGRNEEANETVRKFFTTAGFQQNK